MAKKNDPLKVEHTAQGIRFSGGTFEERVTATVDVIVERAGGAEGLKAILDEIAAKGATLPSGGFCGTGRVTQIIFNDPES